jgi:hypothetical protein
MHACMHAWRCMAHDRKRNSVGARNIYSLHPKILIWLMEWLYQNMYSLHPKISNIDMSGYHISFNSLNKSVISLSATIRALSSHLVPYPESDLETYLYSDSIPTAIKTSPITGSVLYDFRKSITSLQIYPLAQPSSPI